MSTLEERKQQLKLSNAFMAGEKILDIQFRHNSHISFVGENGISSEGWIVSVDPIEPEPIYTIERSDGEGDIEIRESKITLLFDPHVQQT